MVICKYDISKGIATLPKDAKILSIKTQHNRPVIYALVNPINGLVERKLLQIPTGGGSSQDFSKLDYIGTYLIDGGSLVYHVFEYK